MRTVRRGFTLIELLVVIAIIGVLIALLVPAVQRVRESAAQTECSNNIKQIALAAQNYHANYNRFPAGLDTQAIGPLAYLLPYLEQENQYKILYKGPTHRTSGAVGVYWNMDNATNQYLNVPPNTGVPTLPACPNPSGRWGAQGDFKVFTCPSAPPLNNNVHSLFIAEGDPATFPAGLAVYGAPIFMCNGVPDGQVTGGTHYMASGGSFTPWWDPSAAQGDNAYISSTASSKGWTNAQVIDYYRRYNGIYAPYKNGTRNQQVSDGTSNTVAFMEQHGGYVQPGLGLWWDGYWFQGWVSGVIWINFGVCPDPTNTNCWQIDSSYNPSVYSSGPPNFGMGPWVQTPGSVHSGNVMNIAMADGSVHRMVNLPALYNSGILWSLVGMRDGDTASLP